MTRIITLSAASSLVLLLIFLLSSKTKSQPYHMSTFCTQPHFTRTTSYESNRDTLLSTLRHHSSRTTYSNATSGLTPNTIYGMFLCRGDVNRTSCSLCVQRATLEIAKNCTDNKEAFIYYDECMVRYSDFSFFTLIKDTPSVASYSTTRSMDPSKFMNQTVYEKIENLILRASLSLPIPYFVEDQERVRSYDLETMVQCSPDLDQRNCTACLRLAVERFFGCCSNSQPRWAQIFLPKCLLRYNIPALQPDDASFASTNGNKIVGRTFITIITTALMLSVMGL